MKNDLLHLEKRKGKPITVFDKPPAILATLGMSEKKPIVISPGKLKQILEKHNIPLDLIVKAFNEIKNPLMVFKSQTRPNDSIIVITKILVSGKPVIATVYVDRSTRGSHAISSVYIKDRFDSIYKWIEKGLLLYLNKKDSVRWAVAAGHQLPMAGIHERYGNTLLTEESFVKKNNPLPTTDGNCDLDDDYVGGCRARIKQRNPADPLIAFAAGTTGLLSALQIKSMLDKNNTKRRNPATKIDLSPGTILVRPDDTARVIEKPIKAPLLRKRVVGDVVKLNNVAWTVPYDQDFIRRAIMLYPVSKRPEYRRAYAALERLGEFKSNPFERKPTKVPKRRTYEMFQGRPATKSVRLPVSRHAPDKLDQLGDLIELKLSDGQMLRPNQSQFKLCAARGKLWIAGGRFARPVRTNPTNQNVLNPIAEIEHVVYGTRKDHLGDHGYTQYIHKLGEETGKRPILAVDSDGYPVIRGGEYKIESRGIVN